MISKGIINKTSKMAKKSSHKFQIGAVIFKGSRILSTGYNRLGISGLYPQFRKYPFSIHAEQDCLSNINWSSIKKSSIFVIRLNNNGNWLLSYPCKFCMKSIKISGIKWLYYTNNNGIIIKEKIHS